MKVTEHIPGFVSGYEPRVEEVAGVPEMLALPWIAEKTTSPRFHRFSRSEECLMTEYDGGASFYVTAFMSPSPRGGLPIWSYEKAKAAGFKPLK